MPFWTQTNAIGQPSMTCQRSRAIVSTLAKASESIGSRPNTVDNLTNYKCRNAKRSDSLATLLLSFRDLAPLQIVPTVRISAFRSDHCSWALWNWTVAWGRGGGGCQKKALASICSDFAKQSSTLFDGCSEAKRQLNLVGFCLGIFNNALFWKSCPEGHGGGLTSAITRVASETGFGRWLRVAIGTLNLRIGRRAAPPRHYDLNGKASK